MSNIRVPFDRNICFVFQAINQYAKCHNLILIKFFTPVSFAVGVQLTGCVNTEDALEIKGMVIDESTKLKIPGRELKVQGLVEINKKIVPIDVGQFSTDSSGCFTYSFMKIKDARYYNFCLVGDSDYAPITRKIGLYELEQDTKYLVFLLSISHCTANSSSALTA